MPPPRIGIELREKGSAGAALAAIQRAEALGVPMLWATMAPRDADPLTLFAAAAVRTSSIGLGSAIVPTYPRHPVALAAQALVLEQLAPGRFRLGVGPGQRATIEDAFGIPFGNPLDHLREYLTVLRALLREGRVDFSGEYYVVNHELGWQAQIPLYIAALGDRAFRLAGELADGTISWLCPFRYLHERALPAMREGSALAGRPIPRLVAQVPVVLNADREAVRSVARPVVARYASMPADRRMFAAAGYPIGPDDAVPDDLLDDLVLSGSEGEICDRLAEHLAGGIDELLVSLIPAGDSEAEWERLARLIGEMAR